MPNAADLQPINPLLTNFGIAAAPDINRDFVADRAFEPVVTEEDLFQYNVWNQGDQYRREMKETGDRDPAPVADFNVSQTTGKTKYYQLATFASDRERDKAASRNQGAVNLDEVNTRFLIRQAKMNREALFRDALFVTGVWGTELDGDAAGFTRFDDSSSTPILTIQTGMQAVFNAVGKVPNTIITNLKVHSALARHANFTGRVTGGSTSEKPGVVSTSTISRVLWSGWDMEEEGQILVSKAADNTAKEGQTASLSSLFGDHLLICYIDRSVDARSDKSDVTALAAFSWSKWSGMTGTGAAIRRWRTDNPLGTYYAVQDDYLPVATMTGAGYMLLNAHS